MKAALHKFFIPHKHNNYHPHILHTKRAIFYSAFFISLKIILVLFVLAIPQTAFILPDVLAPQEDRLITLANELRAKEGLPALKENTKLNSSALLKSEDMGAKAYFSHTGPDGHNLKYYLNQVGYRFSVAGENLAMGYFDTDELFNAWVASPTHKENILDAEYEDTGIGLSPGLYDGMNTIYVTQHFGKPKQGVVTTTTQAVEIKVNVPTTTVPVEKTVAANVVVATDNTVTSQPEAPVVRAEQKASVVAASIQTKHESVSYDMSKSYLSWSDDQDGLMVLTARASLSGDVKEAVVRIKDYNISLNKMENGMYGGTLKTGEKSDDFFKVVLSPVLTAVGKDENSLTANVPWLSVKTYSPDPLEKYMLAKKNLGPLTVIFEWSRNVYLAFLVFFAAALALSIGIEIRRQHPHIILQTCGMIGLLIIFYII